MRHLSIFVDESGDFGPYDHRCPFYLFTFVFHDQSNIIEAPLQHLEDDLIHMGMDPHHCFHAGPIIRREEEYSYMSFEQRRKLLNRLVAFLRACGVAYHTFVAEKKEVSDSVALTRVLSKQLSAFIQNHLLLFQSFDQITVYYDNGQTELTKILATVFAILLPDAEFRKVFPAQYRLFQIADLICTMELAARKAETNQLSKSEQAFFGTPRDMKKNYFKPIFRHRIDENAKKLISVSKV